MINIIYNIIKCLSITIRTSLYSPSSLSQFSIEFGYQVHLRGEIKVNQIQTKINLNLK